MPKRKPVLTIALFLLPAFTALVAYTAFYERINNKPDCQFNCDDFGLNSTASNQFDAKRVLDLIEKYRKDTSSTDDDTLVSESPTSTDLAFLQEKLKTINNAIYALSETNNLESNWARLDKNDHFKATEDLNQANNAINFVKSAIANDKYSTGVSDFKDTAKLGPNEKVLLADSSLPPSYIDRPTPLARLDYPNFSPTIPSGGSAGGGNNPSLIVAARDAANQGNGNLNPDIQAVPLSPSMYFMLTGLTLFFASRYKKAAALKLQSTKS